MSKATFAAYMHVPDGDSFDRLDFDRKPIRKAFQQAGREVQREARKLVNRKVDSSRGQYPGRKAGALSRSIRYRVSRSGFLVRIAPQMTPQMEEFYPAYLHYGVRCERSEENAKRRIAQPIGPYRIRPRKNYMTDALDNRSGRVRAILRRAFAAALG